MLDNIIVQVQQIDSKSRTQFVSTVYLICSRVLVAKLCF